MSEEITRRGLLFATGAAAVGVGVGVPLIQAIAKELESGEKTSRWAMVVDTKKCAEAGDCDACMKACHDHHNVPEVRKNEQGEPDPNGKLDLEEELKWIWKEPFDHVFPDADNQYLDPEVRHRQMPVFCNHCENPPCVRVCPTQATWKREDGIVMMDMHRCIGCRYCIVGCPYGSRSFNFSDPRKYMKPEDIDVRYPMRSKGVVEKCNFCSWEGRLSEDGTWTPECVKKCPNGALIWGDIRDETSPIRTTLADRLAIRRRPGLGTEPHVFYLV
jgi:molybdopterin-containing oxidoreductase family iron-sulfur binding subunit